MAEKRFIILSIPSRDDDDPTVWFVYDRQAHKPVVEVESYNAARNLARRLNGQHTAR